MNFSILREAQLYTIYNNIHCYKITNATILSAIYGKFVIFFAQQRKIVEDMYQQTLE